MDKKAMAGALPHDPSLPLTRYQEGIHVQPGLKTNEGSCNACANGQYNLNQNNMPIVTVVSMRGMSFRLCAQCRANLKELL